MSDCRIRVYPYRQGSRSARALADALGGRVLKRENSKFFANYKDKIINWGASDCPYHALNTPEAVRLAGNKLLAFRAMQDANVNIPRFATTPADVSWDGTTVIRRLLNGHSGAGIEIVNSTSSLFRAPLYVEYIKKQEEYRVHVIGKSIITVQRKARNRLVENPNWQVRNHHNGFIFVREGFETPDAVLEQSTKAVAACGLDFGAADIIWNSKHKRAYVLEVNTAPGLEGQTINDYAEGFREVLLSNGNRA